MTKQPYKNKKNIKKGKPPPIDKLIKPAIGIGLALLAWQFIKGLNSEVSCTCASHHRLFASFVFHSLISLNSKNHSAIHYQLTTTTTIITYTTIFKIRLQELIRKMIWSCGKYFSVKVIRGTRTLYCVIPRIPSCQYHPYFRMRSWTVRYQPNSGCWIVITYYRRVGNRSSTNLNWTLKLDRQYSLADRTNRYCRYHPNI